MKLQLKHQQLCKQQFLFWLLKQNAQFLSCVHVRTTNSPEQTQEIQTQKSKRKLDQDIHLLARTVKMKNLFSPCSCIEFFDILTHYILPQLRWQSGRPKIYASGVQVAQGEQYKTHQYIGRCLESDGLLRPFKSKRRVRLPHESQIQTGGVDGLHDSLKMRRYFFD